jgi:hypothetical protein
LEKQPDDRGDQNVFMPMHAWRASSSPMTAATRTSSFRLPHGGLGAQTPHTQVEPTQQIPSVVAHDPTHGVPFLSRSHVPFRQRSFSRNRIAGSQPGIMGSNHESGDDATKKAILLEFRE